MKKMIKRQQIQWRLLVILNIDIKEVKAKNLDVTYEFDLSPEQFE